MLMFALGCAPPSRPASPTVTSAWGNGVVGYRAFLDSKRTSMSFRGKPVVLDAINPTLYPFQAQLVQWALRKGRCAVFADCGLGKTFIQLEWSRLTGERTLIVAPLAVAQQTVSEGAKLGIPVRYVRSQAAAVEGISITNYEMFDRFDMAAFGAVVLDESSILKSVDGATRTKLIEACRQVRYRLCCTATPAPNDISEFANHAEFLGVASRQEMLSMFFVHDDDGWRLKGHAYEAFYRWMASWAIMLRVPSDIGFDDAGYALPPLDVLPSWVESDGDRIAQENGHLFFTGLSGIVSRAAARKSTIDARVERAQSTINGSQDQWVVWCGLNEEGRRLHERIPNSVLIEGADSFGTKMDRIARFLAGDPTARVMITKPSIAGFGLNLQQCHNVLFLGLSDSYESYYQAVRRVWRFGQRDPVDVHIILSDMEHGILENVQRKERAAQEVAGQMIQHVSQYQMEELGLLDAKKAAYAEATKEGEGYQMMLGDCVERMVELDANSVDFSVFSPPFLQLYVHTNSERDMGNSKTSFEFYRQYRYMLRELVRVLKPGRNVACHVAQVPTTLAHDRYIGLRDFRGGVIEAFQDAGFHYHGDVTVDKNPQAQAIRTHAKGLLFAQLKKDASWLRPGLADYILLFRKPGDNAVPIHPDISNEDWIQWAHPVWYGIRESDTLNVAEARTERDERHITPLQLGLIERCIRLWSNPGETVLSPFAGIGSEGYKALLLDRKYIGIELKAEYYQAACRNLERAVSHKTQARLL